MSKREGAPQPMTFHGRPFAAALLASLAIHAAALALADLAWRVLEMPVSRAPSVLEVRLETEPRMEMPAPPAVIKNTLDDGPGPVPQKRFPQRPPEKHPGTVARLAPPAEPLPERDLGATLDRLSETLLYPPEALRRGLEGDVVLLLELGDGGRITGASVASSSGHPILDDAAIRAVLRLGTLGAASAGKAVLLPVRFRIQ